MTNYDVVAKLIGPIRPTGDHGLDKRRLENLKEMIELVDKLLGDISTVTYARDNHQHSMKEMGKLAYEFLKDVKESDLP